MSEDSECIWIEIFLLTGLTKCLNDKKNTTTTMECDF